MPTMTGSSMCVVTKVRTTARLCSMLVMLIESYDLVLRLYVPIQFAPTILDIKGRAENSEKQDERQGDRERDKHTFKEIDRQSKRNRKRKKKRV